MALPSMLNFCLLAAATAMALYILPAQASKNNIPDCCVGTRDVPLPAGSARLFEAYFIQEPQMGCSLPAIVLITKKGPWFCYPRESRHALAIMKKLDARAAWKQRQRS